MLPVSFRSLAFGRVFLACVACVASVACAVAPSGALASEDAHAAGPKPGAHASVETPAPATAPASATGPAATTAPSAVKPAAALPSAAAPALKTAADAAVPRAVGKDGKPVPTATPQEVATRIAEKLAALRARQAERSAQEGHARANAPAAGARRPLQVARADTEPRLAAIGSADIRAGHAAADARHAPHWSYGGDEGPVRWAEMNPEWAKCGSGQRQSPIDIRSGIKVELEPIVFDYKVSGFSVIDNGHTIQVNLGAGNAITVSGRTYELLQFHFHRPSEEKINGRGYDMVAHLVHRDGAGKLAVVAVLIERGAARALVQTVWNNLPLEKNEAVTPAGALDMNGILPTRRDYYTYMGSLTTPPCSEGVLWMVMKEPVSVSQDQLDIFARLYQMNARPIQLTAERLIKESN